MPSPNFSTRPLVLVDDEPLILESFGQLLRTHLSCEVYTFSNPFEALQQLIAINPGVIITDYSMPGMNGLKFLAQAQRFVPDTNFIIITGGPVDYSTEELQELPALKGILRKPLHWKSLAKFAVSNWPDATPPMLHEPAVAC
jgi:DNA-binding NarL/FixJ family response regulator